MVRFVTVPCGMSPSKGTHFGGSCCAVRGAPYSPSQLLWGGLPSIASFHEASSVENGGCQRIGGEPPSAVLLRVEKDGKLFSPNTAPRMNALQPGWAKPGWSWASHNYVALINFLFWIFESGPLPMSDL